VSGFGVFIRGFALAALTVSLAGSMARAGSVAPAGPLPIRNHHPLYAGLLYPSPEAAAPVTQTRVSLAVSHSNIYFLDSEGSWKVKIDKELTQFDLAVRHPFAGGRAELGANAPLFYSSAGFLDSFIRRYHQLAGATGYFGQDESADFSFSDTAWHNARQIRDGRRGRAEPGDVTAWVKLALPAGAPWTASIQALAQAPTGEAGRGPGSGSWEAGARLLATRAGLAGAIHLGAGALVPGRIEGTGADVDTVPVLAGFAGYEYYWSARLRLMVQSMFNTSPFANEDYQRVSDPWVEATAGFRYLLPAGVFSFGVSENLNRQAPDFTIHLSFEYRP